MIYMRCVFLHDFIGKILNIKIRRSFLVDYGERACLPGKFISIQRDDLLNIMVWHVVIELFVEKNSIMLQCIDNIDDFVAGDYRPSITALSDTLFIFSHFQRELRPVLFLSNQEGHFLSFKTNNAFSEDGIFE